MPSTIATSPGPCDSPAVVKRKVVIAARLSAPRRLAHHVEVGPAAGPDFQRPGTLLDEDLEAVDDRGASAFGRFEEAAAALAVDHVDDRLVVGELAPLQRQVIEGVLAAEPRGAGVDDQVVLALAGCDHGLATQLGADRLRPAAGLGALIVGSFIPAGAGLLGSALHLVTLADLTRSGTALLAAVAS